MNIVELVNKRVEEVTATTEDMFYRIDSYLGESKDKDLKELLAEACECESENIVKQIKKAYRLGFVDGINFNEEV